MPEVALLGLQRRLVHLDRAEPGTSVHNVPLVLRSDGPIDVARLAVGLRTLARRFPQLAGRVDATGGCLVVGDDELAVETHVAADVADAEAAVDRIAFAPFDLDGGPLARGAVITGPAQQCRVVLVLHHVVADARSLDVLVDALSAALAGFPPGAPPAPESLDRLRRLAAQENDLLTAHAEQFWSDQLAELPALAGQGGEPRPASTIQREVGATARAWVEATARRLGVTPMTVVLAAWEVSLADLVAPEPHAMLLPVSLASAEDHDTVWPLIETVPVVSDAAAAAGFDDLVRRIWQRFTAMLSHPRVPWAALLRRPGLAAHLNRYLFSWQQEERTVELGDATFVPARPRRREGAFHLAVECAPTAAGYVIRVEHLPGVVDGVAADALVERVAALLEPSSPDAATRWDPRSRAARGVEQAVTWGRGAPHPAPGRSLLDLVLDTASQGPERTAVEDWDGARLTYGDLLGRAYGWRMRLQAAGVQAGDLIGTHLPSSAELVAVWLGAWSLGAGFVACDPHRYSARTAEIFSDAAPRVVVGEPAGSAGPVLHVVDRAGPREDGSGLSVEDLVATLRREGAAEEAAYLVYTSGSTGAPKGVVISHRAIARLIASTHDVPFEVDDRVSQLVSISFDVSSYEFWGALTRGATLVIPAPDTLLDPSAVAEFLRQQRITCVVAATAVLNHWIRREPGALAGVRLVMFGGEKADPDVLATIVGGESPPSVLLNIYGPSEAATAVTHHRVTPADVADRDIPIGRPTAGADIVLLDEDGLPVPVGRVGEVWITGPALAAGYWRPQPSSGFQPLPNDRSPAYRTGDLARWAPDGYLRYQGRNDDQVKIRGMRIEPAEVETTARSVAGVSAAAVVVTGDAAPRLRLCYTGEAEAATVADGLRQLLPGPMVPAELVRLDALPMSANGKVDRVALQRLAPPERASAEGSASETERLILEIWCGLLHTDDLGLTDDFFDVGGHSLLVATLAARLEEEFGSRPSIADLMSHRTVRRQAELLARRTGSEVDGEVGSEHAAVIRLGERAAGPPLVLIHPIGGTCGLYTPLARSLTTDGLQVLGLQAPGIAGEAPPLASVEELARHHLDVLDGSGIEPPFLLGGISMGGSIAYEVARLSLDRGDPSPFVALLDTPGPGQLPTLFEDDAEMLVTLFAGNEPGLLDELRGMEPLEMFRKVLGAMSPEDAAHMSLRDLQIFADVWRAHSRALLDFRPTAIACPVHYYKATVTVPPHPPHPERPWQDLLGPRLRLAAVAGTHESIIERPQVGMLAALLDSDLAEFWNRQGKV